ncbi:2-hydroxyacyl-CoA lyase 2-like [Corticium candelabrum]|uniref:2-hydroxyacyl-CoA lyase 2-like n=1 Tax=Corticium candelabrum TaxID=121492 RepID=UPI002E26328B|nr:2-hydroxyacyl-CoA lyase 2-like [Corticium candelabrum]
MAAFYDFVLYIVALIVPSLVAIVAVVVHKLGIIDAWFFNLTEEEKKRNGGDLVAAILKEHGVKFVFTLCGGHISPILVGCEKLGIRVVDTRHEATTVFAADAVSRLSGVIGVAAVTAGPGVTNTVTAVKNAQMAQSPVLLLGGAAPTLLQGRGALQDIDQLSIFKPLCKYCASVRRVRDIIPTLRHALFIAQSGTPGPVFVELPVDVLYSYSAVAKEFLKENPNANFQQRIFQWYVTTQINALYARAFEPRELTPLPVIQMMPTTSDITAAADILSKAKKPVLLIGSQTLLPPQPADRIQQAVESLGVPCFLAGMARGLLGKNSKLHIRQRRRDALKEADVVILAGTVCDFRLGYGRLLSRKSKIIAVNRDYDQLTKNSPSQWRATLAIEADAGSFLVSLADAMSSYECSGDWLKMLRDRDAEKEEANRKKADQPATKYLNPLKLLYCVEEVMDSDSIIVVDGGDFVGSAAYILRPHGPLSWLDPGAFGTLGVGGGFALGAKLCRPKSEVWIIYGDGSLGYSVAEYDTFTRHKLPVISVIGNDAAWTQILREQLPMLGSNVGCVLAHCEYEKVADGFGGVGFSLQDGDENDIRRVLESAVAATKEGKPSLINAWIGKSDFRDGSISM